jgi:hypothetical protein
VTEFNIKDSGKRVEYPSGMKRDVQDDKIDYTIIPIWFLNEFAKLLQAGAKKYGRDNWQLANSQEELERFQASGLRHHFNHLDGQTDEPHNLMAIFNLVAEMSCARNMASAKEETPEPELIYYGDPEPEPSTIWTNDRGYTWCYSANLNGWTWSHPRVPKSVEFGKSEVVAWNQIHSTQFPLERIA